MEPRRYCGGCGAWKYREQFSKGVRRGHCRECDKSRRKAWRRANPGEDARRQRIRRGEDPELRARYNERKGRWHKENRTKSRARYRVYAAVKAGRLVRQTVCERCGWEESGLAKIHAHHDDYTKPLDVEWLCPKCHWVANQERIEKEQSR